VDFEQGWAFYGPVTLKLERFRSDIRMKSWKVTPRPIPLVKKRLSGKTKGRRLRAVSRRG
jgi:hypothetical protein